MKKTLSIILIITMLLSVAVMAIPAAATGSASAQSTGNAVTMPTLPDKGVTNAATGATSVTEPELPAIGTTAGQANIGNTKVSKTDADYKAARAAEGYIPVVNSIREGTPANAIVFGSITDGKNYYLWEDISNPGTPNIIRNVIIDGCGHTITKNGSLFNQTQGTFVFKNLTIKGTLAPGNGTQTLLCAWGSSGETSLYNVTIEANATYKNTYASQKGGLVTLSLTNKNGNAIIDNVKINANLIIDSATTILPSIGLLAGVSYDGVQYSNVVASGSVTIKEGTVIDAEKEGTTQTSEWLGFMGGLVGEATGRNNEGKPAKLENVYSDVDIIIEKNVDITGVNRDGTYPENPKKLYLGGVVGNSNSGTIYKNVVNAGNITIASGAKLRLAALAGFGRNDGGSYENCHNTGNITIYDGVTMYDQFAIAGITGTTEDITATFKNCVNSGDIIVGALASGQTASESWDAKILSIGGIVSAVRGTATIMADVDSAENTYTFENCFNKGDITLGAGIALPYANDTQVEQGIGGIAGRITNNIAFKNCVNTGDIVSNGKLVRTFGGIAAAGRYATNVSFVNCMNGVANADANASNGNIKVKSQLDARDYPTAGGIYGFQYNWSGGNLVRFYNCTNNGDIVDTSTTNTTNGKLIKGGIAAVIRGTRETIFYNCVNNGDITAGKNTHGENMSAGMLAFYATIGDWMGIKETNSELTFNRCTNNGTITANASAAGIFGTTAEIKNGGQNKIRYFKFIDCLNTGKVESYTDSSNVAGIAASIATHSNETTRLDVSFNRCENTNEIKGKVNNVAGILAGFSCQKYPAKLTMQDCENTGAISSGSDAYNVGGIGGWFGTSAANAQSVTEYNPGVTIKGCVNNAPLTGKGNVCGILGFADGNDGSGLTFEDCYNGANGVITSKAVIAGITGELKRPAVFTRCYNLAPINAVNANNTWGGGIVAKINNNATTEFIDCENYGAVYSDQKSWYDTSSVGAFNWGSYGGLVGGSHNAQTVTFTGCDNYGTVTLKDGTVGPSLGGIMGQATSQSGTVTVTFNDCTNNAAVTSGAQVEGNRDDRIGVGGILGTAGNQFNGAVATFNGCVNNGDVTLTAAAKYYNVGGILGFLSNGTANFNKYEDIKTVNNGKIEASGTGAEMVGVGGVLGRAGVDGRDCTLNMYYVENAGPVTGKGSTYASGGIAGSVLRTIATFENCVNKSTGIVTDACTARASWQGAGGIAGFVFARYDSNATTTMIGCLNEAVVTKAGTAQTLPVGGMVGFMRGMNYALIQDCRNEGDISTTGEAAGGMIGRYGTIGGWAGGNITRIEFIDCSNTGTMSARYRVGGILADTTEVSGSDATNYKHEFIFDGCINAGIMNTTADEGDKAGGIVGYIGNEGGENIVSFTDCSNSGTINAFRQNGGILGWYEAYGYKQSISFVNCENTGIQNSKNQTGGIVGRIYGGFKNSDKTPDDGVSNPTDNALGKDSTTGARLDTFNILFDNCRTAGAIVATRNSEGALGNDTAGMVGMLQMDRGLTEEFDGTIAFTNVENNATITAAGDTIGGYIGYLALRCGEFDVDFEKCLNTADITAGNGAGSGGSYVAGFVANLEFSGTAIVDMDFTDCVNTGDVTANGRVAGFIGSIWLHNDTKKTALDLTFDGCVNDADITGLSGDVGGFTGWVGNNFIENDADENKDELTVTVNDAMNLGDITAGGNMAAGFVASVHGSNDKTVVRINDAVNIGNISAGFNAAGGNAGGIFGSADGTAAQIYLDGVINWGSVSTKEWNCHGIYGQNINNKPGQYSEVKNAINFGKLNSSVAGHSKEAPIGYVDKTENVYYYGGSIDDGAAYSASQGMKAQTYERAFSVLSSINSKAFTKMNLEAAMPLCQPYFDKAEKYAEDTIVALQTEYNKGQQMLDANFYGIGDNGEVYFNEQNTIEDQADAILEAIDNVCLKSAMPIFLEETIAKAEKFAAENTNLYKDAAWSEFITALENAKKLYAQGGLYDMDYATIYPIANALKTAQNKLENDESTLGGDIFTAEEFAMLEGKSGEFNLMADITVSAALKNFKGTLNGNGHTITLDGCALFETVNNVVILDLVVVGDAGEAKSIFGAARGEIGIDGLTIDVDGKLEAAIFHEVNSTAEIAMRNVISYADASVAAIVAGNCAIMAEKILVMADAPVLVTAEDAQIRLAYVNAVVYYNASGEKSTDETVFASGEVAYVMNEALGTPDMLVQRIGDQALPVIEKALIDQSNVVRLKDGKYYNPGARVDVPVDTTPKPETPVAPVLSELQKSIARAEVLAKGNYTEESLKALADAVAEAKKALESDDQAVIDAATAAIEIAIASLDEKKAEEVAIDLSKLNDAIKKAEALNMNEYTAGSWSAVSIMLSMAKSTKLADDQAEVDAAVAALEGAIASLVKAPVVEETPDDDKKDDANTDDATEEESGCGSVVGGAAVLAVAVLALGAGVTFKKKED